MHAARFELGSCGVFVFVCFIVFVVGYLFRAVFLSFQMTEITFAEHSVFARGICKKVK